MFLAFIAWLALIALLLWINSLHRALRDWMDAEEGGVLHAKNFCPGKPLNTTQQVGDQL
jgi:hypothetical protein